MKLSPDIKSVKYVIDKFVSFFTNNINPAKKAVETCFKPVSTIQDFIQILCLFKYYLSQVFVDIRLDVDSLRCITIMLNNNLVGLV